MFTQPQRATTAGEWADDFSQMLTTYGTLRSVLTFADERGYVGGIEVEHVDFDTLTVTSAERGWVVRYSGQVGRFAPVAV